MKLSRLLVVSVIIFSRYNQLPAQIFQDINANTQGVLWSEASWGDYDNDGLPDLAVMGDTVLAPSSYPVSRIYHNDGNGIFTNINAPVIALDKGSIRWVDYDNDNDSDLAICGFNQVTGFGETRIYQNNGGVFTDINAAITGLMESAMDWGDYNNDGYSDLIICGYDGAFKTLLYENNGNGTFSMVNNNFIGVHLGAVKWFDYDNDGNLDFILAGRSDLTPSYPPRTRIYRNTGGNNFQVQNFNLADLDYTSSTGIAACKLDNDNYVDLIITGQDSNGARKTMVYKNNVTSFTLQSTAISNIGWFSSVDYFDVDNDSDNEILICGQNDSGAIVTQIYRNNGNWNFSLYPQYFMGVSSGSVKFGDFNNDSREDFVVCGLAFIPTNTPAQTPVCIIYGNNLNSPLAIEQPQVKPECKCGVFTDNQQEQIISTGIYNNNSLSMDLYRPDGRLLFTTNSVKINSDGQIRIRDYTNLQGPLIYEIYQNDKIICKGMTVAK